MVSQLSSDQSLTEQPIIYPDCDGQPMANNTEQFRWILVIQQNLDWLFVDDPNFFVAGDLFWYPVENRNDIVVAPDVMVAMGRPRGKRGSYQQWKEGNVAPQVVFEVLSPSNTSVEMAKKLLFFDRHGVEEYYIYDPQTNYLEGWLRGNDGLEVIPQMADWVSPRLKIRFGLEENELELYRPDGEKFRTYLEIAQSAEQEYQRAEQEYQRAEQEYQRAEQSEQARSNAIAKLLALGLSAEQVAESLGFSIEAVQAAIEQT
jgi:Uma2 family endonuclease